MTRLVLSSLRAIGLVGAAAWAASALAPPVTAATKPAKATAKTEKKDDAGEKLIYMLVHKNKASADANWQAFRADADWVKVKADSEAKGPLTIPGGIQSIYMTPTDYSPTR